MVVALVTTRSLGVARDPDGLVVGLMLASPAINARILAAAESGVTPAGATADGVVVFLDDVVVAVLLEDLREVLLEFLLLDCPFCPSVSNIWSNKTKATRIKTNHLQHTPNIKI